MPARREGISLVVVDRTSDPERVAAKRTGAADAEQVGQHVAAEDDVNAQDAVHAQEFLEGAKGIRPTGYGYDFPVVVDREHHSAELAGIRHVGVNLLPENAGDDLEDLVAASQLDGELFDLLAQTLVLGVLAKCRDQLVAFVRQLVVFIDFQRA